MMQHFGSPTHIARREQRLPANFLRFPAVWLVLLAVACHVLWWPGQLHGQTVPPVRVETQPGPKPDELTLDRLEKLRADTETSTELEEESKKKAVELYRQALDDLKRAADLTAKTELFTKDADEVQRRVQELRERLVEFLEIKPIPPELDALPDLEQELARRQLALAELKNAQVRADSEPATRASRRKEIRALLLSTPERQANAQTQLDAPVPADESPLLTAARRVALQARRRVLLAEVPALQSELAKFDAEETADYVRRERDLRSQEVAFADAEFQLLYALVKAKRAAAAQEAVRKAREDAIAAQPLLKPYLDENQALTQSAQNLTKLIEAADADLKETNARLDELTKLFEQTKTKVNNVGLTSAIGTMLRQQRSALPNLARRLQNVRDRRETIDNAQYQLFDYDDQRADLANPEPVIQQILASAEPSLDPSRGSALDPAALIALEQATRDVIDRKREYLDQLIRLDNTYLTTLFDLDSTEQQLIRKTDEAAAYIDERVLWIRSNKPLTSIVRRPATGPWIVFDESDRWIMNSARWAEVAQTLWADTRENPAVFGSALLFIAALFHLSPRFRQELAEIGETVQRSAFHRIAPTLRAVFLTIIISLPGPTVVYYLGWRWSARVNASEFSRSVGIGLISVGGIYVLLEFFRQVCRASGLARCHFDWPASTVHVFRVHLRWLMWLGLPLVFLTSTLYAANPVHGLDLVERLSFISTAVVLAVFLKRVLHPEGSVLREYLAYNRGGWLDRLKYVWYWIGSLSPLVLAALAFLGYYYTARQLSGRLYGTLWLLVAFLLLRAFLLRLILVHRRRLSIEKAKERRTNAAAAAAETVPAESPTPRLNPSNIATAEDPAVDLTTHSTQTQRLLNTGMVTATVIGIWLIWVDVLPALRMFDRWPLWTTTVEIVEPVTDSTNATLLRTRTAVEAVTVADVAIAILIAIVTIVCARNFPGLMEMSVLQRLPLEPSLRYAITSLTSYVIILLGLIVGFNAIGVGWSKVQWLATALTFGLAFGLQEIFANFVSGLIILFERPIRVGDVVTVDDVSGVVSRIRIRATTITNWDRKEYVIPNKEFITGRLLNWTLTDKVNRIVINVGVAYGTDTERARQIMLTICREHPLILADPPTEVTLEGFGDSALNFVVRTFLPNLDNRLEVIHQLHTAINQAFRDAGIDIAFPQRDLHIRTTPTSTSRLAHFKTHHHEQGR